MLRGKITIFIIFSVLFKQAHAQNFEHVPCYNGEREISRMFIDSLHNEIILSSKFNKSTCQNNYRSVVAYNGMDFHALDIGLQTHDTINAYMGEALGCITFNNKTLIGGNFQSVGTIGLEHIYSPAMALWNGIVWDTLPKKALNYNQNIDRDIYGFYEDAGKLWIFGHLDSLGGKAGKNLFTFDGMNYTAVNIPTNYNDGINKITKYNNDLYIAGSVYNFPFDNYNSILKYKNGIWSNVGAGINSPLGGIADMIVYKDTLYIAGAFFKSDGNPGNNILKWDGTNLRDAGFGEYHGYSSINQLVIYKDRLYTFGNFKYAADKKAFGAAYYENGKWKVNTDSINNAINNAVLYNNEIYISGGFSSINGDSSIRFLAKLHCSDFDNCKNSGVNVELQNNIFPNPVGDKLTVTIDDSFLNSNISIYNNLSQIIYRGTVTSKQFQISCTNWSIGIYFVRLQSQNVAKTFKVVKE